MDKKWMAVCCKITRTCLFMVFDDGVILLAGWEGSESD